jgi:hypothetical protein
MPPIRRHRGAYAIRCSLLIAVASIGCRPNPAPALIAEGRLRPFQGSDRPDQDAALAYGRFGIPIAIHGRTIEVVADHGSNASMLTDAATERLGLPHWLSGAARTDTSVGSAGPRPRRDSAAEVTVTRGDTVVRYWGVPDPRPLDSLRIGTVRQDSVLLAFELPAADLDPFDGLIGRDFLSLFDLLFDLPAGTLRLYQRSPAHSGGQPPEWLPDGLTRGDCIPALVLRHTMDTTGFGEEAVRELRNNPAKRIWEQEDIQLPIRVNDRPINGMFDSGSGATSINWAEARVLGIGRNDPRVHAYMAGGLRMFAPTRPPPGSTVRGSGDSTFEVSGLALQIGRERLPADTIFISDPDFVDSPNYATVPMISIGLRQVRDYQLFLSYSTGFVCVSRAQRPGSP